MLAAKLLLRSSLEELFVSSRACLRNVVRVGMRSIAVASVLMLTGCAYFHPAFMTNASAARMPAQEGVLVCERRTLREADCTRMSRTEVREFLEAQPQHY